MTELKKIKEVGLEVIRFYGTLDSTQYLPQLQGAQVLVSWKGKHVEPVEQGQYISPFKDVFKA